MHALFFRLFKNERKKVAKQKIFVEDLHVHNADAVKAEIIWILKSICSGYSNRSCEQLNCTFKAMFPDSKIAEAFSMGRTKSMYMINHGLAPFLSHFCYLS